jgi:site-specific recombinase XerD
MLISTKTSYALLGKGDKERIVPLGRQARAALVDYLGDGGRLRRLVGSRRRNEVFVNTRGGPLDPPRG